MRIKQFLILGLGVMLAVACRREGCTDQSAKNYDSKAKNDNGTCIYDGDNPGGQNLPVDLTGTEDSDRTIKDLSTDPNVADYFIDGEWKIDAAIIIEPGVRIKMKAGSSIRVYPNGSIKAIGNENARIHIYGEQSSQGFWKYIYIESNNPNNNFEYCTISDGSSSTWGDGMITIEDGAQLGLKNSVIANASENGILLKGTTSRLTSCDGNQFTSINKYPVSLSTFYQVANFTTSNTFTSNGKNKIYVKGGGQYSDIIVPNLDVPYAIYGTLNIAEGHTTVSQGTTIEMMANSGIDIKANGSLALEGTSSNRITIKGENAAKGYWKYLYFESNNPNNIFSYVNISDGSDGTWGNGVVTIYNGMLNMDNTQITHCSKMAVETLGTSVFNNNGGNSWSDCDGGGGDLP